MRTFCSLTWRVREGRFPDTIILGNSGSVVCSILLQGEKTPCKTPWKFESKFNSCSTQQTCEAYKKNLIFNCILPTIKAMLKEKSKPDFKSLLFFSWLHPPISPEQFIHTDCKSENFTLVQVVPLITAHQGERNTRKLKFYNLYPIQL